ncbi:hypothetical protein CLV47_102424 [Antricoccus suffuscus]|uniref:Uncharacterized protein n=1 Tax=Antricoccus suffuscus TaxID=1629062 RepID=A0A2T1A556_9ACTN|nr:hypothetical protein [Antricoccus suffuscus]PRZ43733.1 hypothetical protein CLV47_102424 [Antricoccus suffuscus]
MTESTNAPAPSEDEQAPKTTPPHAEAIKAAAKNLTKFADAHGGAANTFVEYVASSFTRVVVVAKDGRYGDQVLPSAEAAEAVTVAAGLEVTPEWDRESTDSVKTSGYEWGRMGRGRAAK